MNKPRSDAILLNLKEEQQAELAEWLLNGLSLQAAKARVRRRFGVAMASLTPLHTFWHAVCGPKVVERRCLLRGVAKARSAAAKRCRGEFDEATMDALRQRLYAVAEAPGSAPREVRAMLEMVLAARGQELKREALKLMERRVELAEAKAGRGQGKHRPVKFDLRTKRRMLKVLDAKLLGLRSH